MYTIFAEPGVVVVRAMEVIERGRAGGGRIDTTPRWLVGSRGMSYFVENLRLAIIPLLGILYFAELTGHNADIHIMYTWPGIPYVGRPGCLYDVCIVTLALIRKLDEYSDVSLTLNNARILFTDEGWRCVRNPLVATALMNIWRYYIEAGILYSHCT